MGQKKQRKVAGKEGGKHGAEMAWQNASPEKQERKTAAGQAFGNLSTERQDDLRQLGRQNCHLGATGARKLGK